MNQLCYYVVQTNGAPMRTIESKLSHPPLTRSARQTWVQTDRAAHEAWGHLVHKSPRAAALMHHLVAHMDQSAAVVASYATLAKICGFSVATVRRAVDDLKSRQWIQVVQIGGKGAANAFVVNSRGLGQRTVTCSSGGIHSPSSRKSRRARCRNTGWPASSTCPDSPGR